MWQKIYLYLKSKGIKVYSPGQHSSLCTESYVVLRHSGGNAFAGQNKVGYSIMDAIIYHPKGRYSTLDDYKKLVKNYMKEIEEIRHTGFESIVLLEDEKQAYTLTLQYQILKRI